MIDQIKSDLTNIIKELCKFFINIHILLKKYLILL